MQQDASSASELHKVRETVDALHPRKAVSGPIVFGKDEGERRQRRRDQTVLMRLGGVVALGRSQRPQARASFAISPAAVAEKITQTITTTP